MRLARVLIAIAVLLGAAMPSYASAQVEATPIPAPKKPDFSSMQFMIGSWTCSTKSARRPAAYVTISTYTIDPSGWWIDETSTTNPTKWIPIKLTNYDKITYDSDTHRWVDLSYGPANGYGLTFANGWNGNKIVWRDAAFAPGADIGSTSNNIVTKVSDTKITSSSSFTETKTGRRVAVMGICTKH